VQPRCTALPTFGYQVHGAQRATRQSCDPSRSAELVIVFHNDDYTSMDFVILVMTKVFHRSTEDALALTLAVHTQGKGIAGTYTFEVAEQKRCEVLLMAKIEEHPLRVEVERA
jgi:ATP-dependent Clp protease adaptor protein ClpS